MTRHTRATTLLFSQTGEIIGSLEIIVFVMVLGIHTNAAVCCLYWVRIRDAFPDTLFFLVLLLIMYLWRPSNNNARLVANLYSCQHDKDGLFANTLQFLISRSCIGIGMLTRCWITSMMMMMLRLTHKLPTTVQSNVITQLS